MKKKEVTLKVTVPIVKEEEVISQPEVVSQVETTEEIKEESPVEVVASDVESPERAAFKEYIEQYKKKNPVKYESKKEELEYKLSLIK